ncbi:MAG: hypothetical protein AAF629_34765, partial [Chloroflexota bacterium]
SPPSFEANPGAKRQKIAESRSAERNFIFTFFILAVHYHTLPDQREGGYSNFLLFFMLWLAGSQVERIKRV